MYIYNYTVKPLKNWGRTFIPCRDIVHSNRFSLNVVHPPPPPPSPSFMAALLLVAFGILLVGMVLCARAVEHDLQGCQEDWGGGGGANTLKKNRGHAVWILQGGWGTHQNFEIYHSLKCVLRAHEALFLACTQYIYTCKLPSSTPCVVSNFRLKITYGVLPSGLHAQ